MPGGRGGSMLITAREVIEVAYITLLDDNLIKEDIIDTAEKTYIKPVLTESLYNNIIANPGSYTTLIDEYIKPCLAFFAKYLIYSQQLFETAEYSNPDPTKGKELIDQATAALITNEVHQNIINDILFIARQKEIVLKEYIDAQSFELYQQPTTKRISGFLINSPFEGG